MGRKTWFCKEDQFFGRKAYFWKEDLFLEGRLFGRKTNFLERRLYFSFETFILKAHFWFCYGSVGVVVAAVFFFKSRLGFLIKLQKGWNCLTKCLIFLNAIIVGNFYINLVVYKSGDHEITYLDPRWRGWTSSSVLVMYCRIKMIVNLIWKCYSC